MGVLRAGEEAREHGLRGVLVGSIPERGFPVSLGAAPLGLGIPPRVPTCLAAPRARWGQSSLPSTGSWVAGHPYF